MKKSHGKPKIHVALPVLNEFENIPGFTSDLRKQSGIIDFELYVCVNQPNEWWEIEEKKNICLNNRQTISYLQKIRNESGFPINIIDKSSKGNGWQSKKLGVGWARKTIMDEINIHAKKNDLIVSIDADTGFNSGYFQSVIDSFQKFPKATALAVPYYHRLTDDDIANRAILHYEIYMRYYNINLLRIKSPYNFTALGSAFVLPVWAYRNIGGMTPKKSGEDFYFLQKLRKYGNILLWNKEKVYPAARFSDRVFFGTGPAMIKGSQGDWDSYPIYSYHLFDNIRKTYRLFPTLFEKDIETPLDDFLQDKFKNENIWKSLRKNSKNQDNFVKACFEKIDGLRILQYLKSEQKKNSKSDEENLIEFLSTFYKEDYLINSKINLKGISLKDSNIEELNTLRNFLVKKEEEYQIVSIGEQT